MWNKLSIRVQEIPTWAKIGIAGGIGLGTVVFAVYKYKSKKERESPYVSNYEPGMVYLFQYHRCSTIPSISPFCLKLETWLRIADISYKNVEDLPFSIRSREGTLPFVELDGIEYPDSNLAIRDLTSILSKESLESHLTDEQKAVSRALEVMVEHSLLFGSVKFRMQYARETFALFNPKVISSWMIPVMGRWWTKIVIVKLRHNGIGRHSDEDICRITEQDLLALSNYLGAKHYFTGFKATRVDAAIFAVLATILYLPFETPQKGFIETNCANLREFCERIKGRYWPDWEECTKHYSMNSEWKLKA